MKYTILSLALLISMATAAQDTLKSVTVEAKRKGLKKSLSGTANTTLVTSHELLKAACCNLAESFETKPIYRRQFFRCLNGYQTNQNAGSN